MEPAEKGAHYARIFRKAGILLGKGRIARAVVVLEEGRVFAERVGDRAIANRFKIEVERVGKPAQSLDQ
jgi:hypothetical protein